MSFLTLAGVEKTYPDGTRAVKGVDLAIGQGEFIVLLESTCTVPPSISICSKR